LIPLVNASVLILAFILLLVLLAVFILYREKNIRDKEAQKTALQQLRAANFQYQLEIEQIINYFATSMSGQTQVDAMLWDVCRNCIARLGFEDAVIYLIDHQTQILHQKAACGPKTTAFNVIVDPIEIPVGNGIVGSVALSGMAEIIPDTSLDARYIVDDAQRLSELAVPVISNRKVIGVIDSEHSEKNFYTAKHLQVLTTIASMLAHRIEKMHAEDMMREREIELIQLHADLATYQLTALRAQMNPHFIFNALNSIQQFILQGNADEANRYLARFSKLQRDILHHCDQHLITLEKEIEMLQLYLQLEQLRFQGDFEFSIEVDDEIDANEIRIPPMLLQPFVENAIWHGLMPRKENRQVQISFQPEGDHLLLCMVQDNGIGRVAAAQNRKECSHESKGLLLVNERLRILQQQYQQPFEASITDRLHPDGTAAGTTVTLRVFIGG
jgi:putative methionine-R-sulfoxide reductase with GAF domain